MNFFIFFFIFLTRLVFVSPNALFFDSPEYLKAFSQNSILKALTYGHLPTHPLFIFLGRLLGSVSLISACSGIITAVFLFLLVKEIFNEKVARISILIYSFLPYVWLSQTNFAIESLLIMFFLASYWFLYRFLKKGKLKFFCLAVIFFIAALLTHFSILIFSISFLGLLVLFNLDRKNLVLVILFVTLSLILSIFIYFLPFYLTGNLTKEIVRQSLFMHLGERVDLINFPTGTLRYLRNVSLILIRSVTFIVLSLSAAGLIVLRKKPKQFWFLLIFFLPFLYSSQFWHVGQFGRTSLPALIPVSILVAAFLKKSKFIFFLLLYLIFAYAPIMFRYKSQNQPLLIMQAQQKILNQGGLFFDSHLARPFTSYRGEVIHVGFLGGEGQIRAKIKDYLDENKPIYLDSFALFDPYLSYDASTLHILGMGKFGVSEAKDIFKNNYLKLEAVADAKNRVFIYKIINRVSQETLPKDGNYVIISGEAKPGSPVYVYSKRWFERILPQRFDYFDPVSWLWVFISGRHEPLAWTYADKSGHYEVPIPKGVKELVEVKKEI